MSTFGTGRDGAETPPPPMHPDLRAAWKEYFTLKKQLAQLLHDFGGMYRESEETVYIDAPPTTLHAAMQQMVEIASMNQRIEHLVHKIREFRLLELLRV